MKLTSLKRGTRRMTQGSAVSNEAAMIGNTAFFAPLMATLPCNGTPPLIERLSMKEPVESIPPKLMLHTRFGRATKTLGRPL